MQRRAIILLTPITLASIVAAVIWVNSYSIENCRWTIPEDVGGASFMAFGSAVPEITVNLISTIATVLGVQKMQKKEERFVSASAAGNVTEQQARSDFSHA